MVVEPRVQPVMRLRSQWRQVVPLVTVSGLRPTRIELVCPLIIGTFGIGILLAWILSVGLFVRSVQVHEPLVRYSVTIRLGSKACVHIRIVHDSSESTRF